MMKNEQSCQIWSLASDKAEYEQFKHLLSNNTTKNVIDQTAFNELLQQQAISHLKGAASTTVIHDPCNIRKRESQKMENLDRVRDLDGKIINGYRTFNSVLLTGQKLFLLGCRPYSQKEDSQKSAGHLSNKEVSFDQIRAISKAIKADFPERRITHLFDREADDTEYFELIDKELEDLFIFRLKTNRNSDVEYWDAEKEKQRFLKLHLKPLENQFTFVFQKFLYRGKCYQQVRAKTSYEKTFVGADYYNVVKIELFDRKGKAIFAKPMVLITNYDIPNDEIALWIYQKYLKRSKIEGVFKFLKEDLGWESFRVRDFQAIKNIILLGFFVGAYFCEIEPQLIDNPLVIIVCQLAKSKGRISRHFFMKGLAILAQIQMAEQFFKEHNFSNDDLQKLKALLE